MNFLPITINIRNEQILIIGGGKVALHKVELLERFTRSFKIIAPEIIPALRNRNIEVVQRKYRQGDLDGHLLVYAATDNPELNHRIREDGKKSRSLVNVVDSPAHCDFVSPAIYKKEHMTIAVSSNGEDVYASIDLRNKIRTYLENGE